MAYVTTDKCGTESIFADKPQRYDDSFWDDNVHGYLSTKIELPAGTIKKLIGRDLTWEDKPIEI